MSIHTTTLPKAGHSIIDFCNQIDISRGMFYKLEGDLAPKTVKLGRSRIVIEAPSEYLNRISALQSAGGAQ